MFPALKFAVIGCATLLTLLTAFKVIYINITPGMYVKYGCCSYGYLTKEELQKEKMKINICPKVECKIEESPEYKIHSFFNRIDSYK